MAFLRQVAAAVRPRIAALPNELPGYGFCHGDTGSANAHITADGRLTLFDFDMCGAGWRAYDIATFLIDEPEAIVHAFLEGYESVRTLGALERTSIPIFQIVQSIWVLGLRANYANDWGNALLSDRLVLGSALHGVLIKIRDLGLPLLAVTTIATSDSADAEQ
jgi:Ser/Thr protein kinase RdoA (MazF antagonist)